MDERTRARIEAERERIKLKERTIGEVRRRYARYGHEVVDVIIHYAVQTNGLMNLVAMLSKNITVDVEELHREIIRFLQDYGSVEFLRRVRK